MINKKGAIQLIILGSLIVVAGVVMYLNNIAGSVGLIILGGVVEAVGVGFYITRKT